MAAAGLQHRHQADSNARNQAEVAHYCPRPYHQICSPQFIKRPSLYGVSKRLSTNFPEMTGVLSCGAKSRGQYAWNIVPIVPGCNGVGCIGIPLHVPAARCVVQDVVVTQMNKNTSIHISAAVLYRNLTNGPNIFFVTKTVSDFVLYQTRYSCSRIQPMICRRYGLRYRFR